MFPREPSALAMGTSLIPNQPTPKLPTTRLWSLTDGVGPSGNDDADSDVVPEVDADPEIDAEDGGGGGGTGAGGGAAAGGGAWAAASAGANERARARPTRPRRGGLRVIVNSPFERNFSASPRPPLSPEGAPAFVAVRGAA